MTTILISVAAFVGVAALVGGVAIWLRGDGATMAEDRLDLLTGAKQSKKGVDAETKLLSQPLDEGANRLEELISRIGNVRRFMEQADAPFTPSKFFAIVGGAAGFGAVLCLHPAIPLALAPVMALVFAGGPIFWLWFRRKRRLAKFAKQLPEALELVSRALRAGHSLGAGMSLVAAEMQDPIAKEFERCYEEQNFGIPLDESLEEMTERVPNLDLRFFATAVILQRQTGGDLAEILDKIGYLIRERFKIWGQIQALTGEGRLSGIVLLGLPPCLFIAMYRLNPTYCMVLFEDPLGHQMLAVAVVMQIIGALVIRKIINIKV